MEPLSRRHAIEGTLGAFWLLFQRSDAAQYQREYDRQPAPDFLFDQSSPLFEFQCEERGPSGANTHAARPRLVLIGQAPYAVTRVDELTIPRAEAPSLTITADPSHSIAVTGGNRLAWSLRFCAKGEGQKEDEAREHLKDVAIQRTGGTVSLNNTPSFDALHASGALAVDAPADAPLVVHASSTAVRVRNMSGPVRIAATHARGTILKTTGQVDATASVVDFAGDRGRVTLNAEAEINIKLTAARFDGSLSAWAQRSVRALVPSDFMTPLHVVVNREEDFVCRTRFRWQMRREKIGSLYHFTYRTNPSSLPEHVIQLRSEEATVVIDERG